MLFFIDASNLERVELALVSKGRIFKHQFNNFDLSENLLPEINKFFLRRKVTFSNLTKLAVVVGPGPFSKVRTAVAVGNALALGLGIPAIPVQAGYAVDLAELAKKKGQPMLEPFYDKQPNITLAKSA